MAAPSKARTVQLVTISRTVINEKLEPFKDVDEKEIQLRERPAPPGYQKINKEGSDTYFKEIDLNKI